MKTRNKTNYEPAWISQIFNADQCRQNGGTVRRSIADVEKYASENILYLASDRRGFKVVKTTKNYLVLC